MSNTPKKGKAWLADKLKQSAGNVWREPDSVVMDWKGVSARLVSTTPQHEGLTPSGVNVDAEARAELRASDIVALMSIRLRAVDRRSPKRRLLETWLSGTQLQRLVVRPRPTREGIGHDRYSVMIQFLQREGLAMRDGNGYKWTPAFTSMCSRAEWLTDTLRGRGEIRTQREGRYTLLD